MTNEDTADEKKKTKKKAAAGKADKFPPAAETK